MRPAVANGNSGHVDWVKIGLRLLNKKIDNPLRRLFPIRVYKQCL